MKRQFFSAMLCMVLCGSILLMAGCAASSQSTAFDRGSDAASIEPPQEQMGIAFDSYASDEATASGEMAMADDADATYADAAYDGAEAAVDGQADTASMQGRRIIRNANMRIEADDVLTALNEATALSVRFGGYTTQSRVWYASDLPYASITFAVPVERFESAMQAVRDLGSVQDEQVSSQDVTSQFVDLEARIRNLESTVERVRGFLDEASNVEDALAVNSELSSLESQLEVLKGQRNALAQRTSFSTIVIEFAPVPPQITTQDVLSGTRAWAPGETFNDALNALLQVAQAGVNAAIWLIVLGIPTLLILAVLWWIARRIVSAMRRPVKKETAS